MRDRVDPSQIAALLQEASIGTWGVASNEPPLSPLAPPLPTAISLVKRLCPDALEGVQSGPTLVYLQEYQRVNALLNRASAALADRLQQAGYAARAVAATIEDDSEVTDWGAAGVFPHKTAAAQAGLGWIGKTALFVSPRFGPRVRLATAFTDLRIPPGTPITSGSCGACRRCLDACPVHAGRDVQWRAGMARSELYDEKACEHQLDSYDERFDGICGICLAVCPYGRA